MPPKTTSEELKSNHNSVSASIISSLSDLASSATVFGSNLGGKGDPGSGHYKIPNGSQDIPHPRTISDILLRTIFIQLCAALAYALFLHMSKQASQVKGRRFGDLPGPWLIWPMLSVLLPELAIVQIALWRICAFFPFIADAMGIGSSPRLQPRMTQRMARRPNMWTTILQSVILYIPLYYAGLGYRERLFMRYHQADYVGNLGIDHRNGWAVVSGVYCLAATVLNLFRIAFGNQQVVERSGARYSGVSSRLDSIVEEYEEEAEAEAEEDDDWAEKDRTGSQRRKNPDDSEYANGRSISPTTPTKAVSSRSTRQSWAALLNSSEVNVTLSLTSIIHQIPLAVTNRLSPLVAVVTTRWCLSVIPIIFLSIFALPYTQRSRVWRALFSLHKDDKKLVFFTLLRTMTVIIPWLLVGITIFVQVWSDLSELQDIGHEILQPWNYRWRVKDIFSHRDRDRVYMG